MMMVVIMRGIDLSIGSNVALSAMVTGILFRDHGASLWQESSRYRGRPCCGMLNGFLIAYLKIPPIIVTLGTMNAYRGLTFIISQGKQVTGYELSPGTTDFVSQEYAWAEFWFPAGRRSLFSRLLFSRPAVYALRARSLCSGLQPGSGFSARHQLQKNGVPRVYDCRGALRHHRNDVRIPVWVYQPQQHGERS